MSACFGTCYCAQHQCLKPCSPGLRIRCDHVDADVMLRIRLCMYGMRMHAAGLLHTVVTVGRHSLAARLAGAASQPTLRASSSLIDFGLSGVRTTLLMELMRVFFRMRCLKLF